MIERTARHVAGVMIMLLLVLAGYTQPANAQKNSGSTGVRPQGTAKSSSKAPTKSSAKSSSKSSAHRAAQDSIKRLTDPDSALWPVDAPLPLPGSILPNSRIVAFYGNPLSKGMGILGALPPDQMLAKLDSEVARWTAADPATPVQPALHLIVDVADRVPGKSGKYRTRMDSALIEKMYNLAHAHGALLFLDLQVGQGTLQEEVPRLAKYLMRPDVHLAIDPEFSMKHGEVPASVVGTFDAADVNYASDFLQQLVDEYHLPPKLLVVHRFRRAMLTGYKQIKLDPRVQIVIDMDGWGPKAQKIDSYRAYVEKYPVEYTGFKLFYKNDKRVKGSRMMTPEEVLKLNPRPLYIQYQ
ncbi:MAG TPA: hypothetical protein VGM67_02325 [Gemmatimonadaceae bacterium]